MIIITSKGSILIEVLLALAIISIIITVSFKNIVSLYKSTELRRESFLRNEALFIVCNEIKYNVKYNRIKEKLLMSDIVLKYNNNFFNEIQNKDILSMNTTEDVENNSICISLISEYNQRLKIRVLVKNNKEDFINEVIDKAEWMDAN